MVSSADSCPCLLRWKRALRGRAGWGRYNRVQGLCCPRYNLDSPLYLFCCSPHTSSPDPSTFILTLESLPILSETTAQNSPSISLQGQSSTTASHAPWGHYCLSGTHSPRPCPTGTFRNSSQAKVTGECLPCPAGTFSAAPGQTGCLPCGSSAFSLPGECPHACLLQLDDCPCVQTQGSNNHLFWALQL